ncbi:MAG TPA: hypothetical protein VMT67_05035 [Terriglobales bacterium]|nr:hypothetical protein [Terriglobales bacterium]
MENYLLRPLLERLLNPIFAPVKDFFHQFSREGEIERSIVEENRLASEVKQNFPFLFDNYAGNIVPLRSEMKDVPTYLQRPTFFDYAVVIVATGEVLFRFLRGRGELSVQIATTTTTEKWKDLAQVLHWLSAAETPRPETSFTSLRSLDQIAEALQPRMSRLLQADWAR